jgi:ferredoxin
MEESEIDVRGQFEVIPNFRMPVTFTPQHARGDADELRGLYPGGMMKSRVMSKPVYLEELCVECGDCVVNCPAEALTLEPEFNISDECIACFCCVELCPEGALEVPDIEAFRHY